MDGLLKWLMATPVGEAVRGWTWLYPGLEAVHMIGLGLVFGGIFLFDLRLLGMSKSIPVVRLAHHVLPWVLAGFMLSLLSGFALFTSDAVAFAANRSFQIKMLLLVLAGLNAAMFHAVIFRSAADWDQHIAAPLIARLAAVVSILVWSGVVLMGRLMAYWE